MRKPLRTMIISALAFGMAPLSAAQLTAAPVGLSQPGGITEHDGIQDVQYRGWRGDRGWGGDRGWRGNRGWREGRYRRGRGWGPAIGGLAAGLAIGALTAPRYGYAAPVYDGDGGAEQCAATFRSFNPATGTYVTYGGEVRVCPYL